MWAPTAPRDVYKRQVQDPTGHGTQARGKQTLQPGGMFYPAQSGIWQTVWLERVPENYIQSLTAVSYTHLDVYKIQGAGVELPCRQHTAHHGVRHFFVRQLYRLCAGHQLVMEMCIRDRLLVKQVQSSVYMEDTLRRLGELGVDHILDCLLYTSRCV